MTTTRIYQLELTNACNARCHYCPHDKMTRRVGFVSADTVNKVISHCETVGQKYIALHHMGEPLLHGRLTSIVTAFSHAGIRTELSTNGEYIIRNGDVVRYGLARMRIAVDYFYNQIGYLDDVVRYLRNIAPVAMQTEFILHTVSGNDMSRFEGIAPNVSVQCKSFDNWAGAVEGTSRLVKGECYFKKYDYVVVLWDGRVVPCCMDYDGTNVMGTIDDMAALSDDNCSLCDTCAGMQFADQGEWEK